MWGAIASIGAGLISSAGSAWQNRQNRKHQSNVNDISIELANTAHQREVEDLKKAGLNPILSAGGAGSAVPSLGTPDQVNPGQGFSDGLTSASKYVNNQYKAAVKNTQANTAQLHAATEKTNAEIGEVEARTAEAHARIASLNAQTQLLSAQKRGVDLSNTAAAWQNNLRQIENETEIEMARAKREASFRRLGFARQNYDDDSAIRLRSNRDKTEEYINLLEEGFTSDAKLRSNANWRANLDSFSQGVNSASGAYRNFRYEPFKYQPRFYR